MTWGGFFFFFLTQKVYVFITLPSYLVIPAGTYVYEKAKHLRVDKQEQELWFLAAFCLLWVYFHPRWKARFISKPGFSYPQQAKESTESVLFNLGEKIVTGSQALFCKMEPKQNAHVSTWTWRPCFSSLHHLIITAAISSSPYAGHKLTWNRFCAQRWPEKHIKK